MKMEIKYRRFHSKLVYRSTGKNQNPVPSSPRSKDIIHNGSPVKTGDDSPVAGYLFLFFGSVICLCGLLMEKQKNRKEDAKNEA